ncbi:S8 family serine peptidase [Bradyrhizobium ontarionense]|uniref:S8 family serine peptidase n=1 Tax=Bradyrhizobium ontarionense TaxID=2898149 RepID=A0ABY3R5R9_9BRAD|nr:S8 family serine peptidase [Bradyrhizobium sp. A19]UFZ02671.1 S8 family serine peptidase [Bradyrhizobium sp. A19]
MLPDPGSDLLVSSKESNSAADTSTRTSAFATTASTEAPPTDDLFDDQWHFGFLGDIQKIWEEFTGAGVHVGIYDDGIQTVHPDLAPNYDAGLEVTVGGEHLDASLPITTSLGGAHGTAVAGLIAAARDGFGTVGVAYGSSITGVPIFSGTANINGNFAGFLEALSQAGKFDIISNSWGAQPIFYQAANASNAQIVAGFMAAVESGRGGLGTIITKAAGNDDLNANGDAADTSRATIVVGAYDATGDAAWYSNFGANLLVSAPSSGDRRGFLDPADVHIDPGLVTTDLLGDLGYNMSGDLIVPSDYTNQFGGTSGATPIVSGIVALMLDANADLGWRDVQNILAYSAREIGSGIGGQPTASEDNSWFYNGANNWNGGGLHFSEDYGFGAVDAYNAVRMAEVWSLFAAPQVSANETSVSSTFSAGAAISDLTSTDIQFDFSGKDFDVEFVNIDIDIAHSASTASVVIDIFGGIEGIGSKYLADLSMSLISPDGTVVELADFNRDFIFDDATGGVHLSLGANAFRGEDVNGIWTLRITDSWFGNEAGRLNAATVTLHGRDDAAGGNDLSNDVYHYTNEVLSTLANQSSRQTLSDDGGNADWLDMAAMTGNLIVSLVSGDTSSVDGQAFLTFAADTAIENAVTGDGNDVITGNQLDNKLCGMRGNDMLIGGDGSDTLSGGAGSDVLEGDQGADHFLFDRALDATANLDIIVDFSHHEDTIWLDSSIFAGLDLGTLSIDVFYVVGQGSLTALDRILYDASTGALFFDADGSGSAAAVQFARLSDAPSDLSADDIAVVSSSPQAIVAADDRTVEAPPTVTTAPADRQGAGTVMGTSASETLRGDAGDNEIYGLGGDDIIFTGPGNNFVDGGAGIDTIIGGDGNDTLIGGGAYPLLGDSIAGGGGNDLLIGSDDQTNDEAWKYLGARGDYLNGGTGNDKLYGLSGDDLLVGGDGNDLLVGGSGSDDLIGGDGDDRLLPGSGDVDYVTGGAGLDTLVLAGKEAEYCIYMLDTLTPAFHDQTVYFERIVNGVAERTGMKYDDIEQIAFADHTRALSRPVVDVIQNGYFQQSYDPIERQYDGYEIGSVIDWADDVTIADLGAEHGKRDMLQTVGIEHTYGTVDISSDALTLLELTWLGRYTPNGNALNQEMTETVTVHAAAGTRELTLMTFGMNMGADAKIIDDTATSVRLVSDPVGSGLLADKWNGAAVNDFNLSFASATSLTFLHVNGGAIKWYVPNVTTITAPFTGFSPVEHLSQLGQFGILTIETPLDDSRLATAGGDAGYSFSGGMGSEQIRFGNLGDVNMSNDGTQGEDAGTNAGRGLRGSINLGAGDDEARILGSGAFQDGGTLDGGVSEFTPIGSPPIQTEVAGDTLRMTFAVAAAIGDISGRIQNFETLQLDATSLTNQVVDVAHFDSLAKLRFTGGTHADVDNSVIGVVDHSDVTIRSVSDPVQSVDGLGGFLFTTYGNDFGTLHLDLAGDSANDTITLHFIGLATDGEDQGTIHIVDAETVNITTDSRDATYHDAPFDPNIDIPPLSSAPTDALAQILDLDATTTLKISGNTGWDLTVDGTDIGALRTLDASGVTGEGAVGSVKAIAQTSEAVVFTGGMGNDELTGNVGDDTLAGGAGGNDTLDGGAGTDTAVFTGTIADYAITINDRVVSVTNLHDGTVDTVTNVELFQFADGTLTDRDIGLPPPNQPPTELSLANAVTEIAENSATDERIKIADIVVTDDGHGTNTLGLAGSDSGLFEIDGNALYLKAGTVLDFESGKTQLDVTVTVDDAAAAGSPDASIAVSIAITDVNEAPTDIALGGTAVAENAVAATVIGMLSASDPDANDVQSFELTDDAGGRFAIVDDKLVVADGAVLDFETNGSHEVSVKVTDSGGLSTDRTFSIDVTDVNEAASVSLAPVLSSIAENTPIDAPLKVADIILRDPDTASGFRQNTLALAGSNASAFEILTVAGVTGLYLKAGAQLDYEQMHGLDVSVVVDDASIPGGPEGTVSYHLAITDVAETPVIRGTPGNDTLVGTDGNDLFDGAGGRDTFIGHRGDDIYLVDSANDKVIERWHEGTDTVESSAINYTLGHNVENLVLLDGARNGNGNSESNAITGNADDNRLDGRGGDDIIEGGGGNDDLRGGAGIDTVSYEHATSAVSVSLAISCAQDTGTSTGIDTLRGFENLKGSSFDDHLEGDRNANVIEGGAGNDVIDGGRGNDTLTGGDGADAFVFSSPLSSGCRWTPWGPGRDEWSHHGAENHDTITDFSVADDTIWLDHQIFAALRGHEGQALSASEFRVGSKALDGDDHIIYNAETGMLIYDANGNKAGGAIEIAILSKGLAMTNEDFLIV